MAANTNMKTTGAASATLSTLAAAKSAGLQVDKEYPGTAVARMLAIRERVKSLTRDELSGEWGGVRRKILWAGGLRDLPNARPGRGYTGHSFNDWNHVDLCAMNGDVSANENSGEVKGIAIGNQLGPGIQIASLPELGPGGSWSTCMMGCNRDPPRDVAHVQFRSRIAFKLVWCPPAYDSFVLVDDAGELLNYGKPETSSKGMPSKGERDYNYKMVKGSKYAKQAEIVGAQKK